MDDGKVGRMKGRSGRILFLLAVAVLALWGYLRIHTYATGQDPRTFLLIAKQFLGSGPERISGVFVVPGWPLLLAGVIRVFGIHAAFWTNVPLFVALAWALRLLVAETGADGRRSAAVAGVSLLLVLGGYPLNAHYLLWAFRQTPLYLAAVLAMFSLRRAAGRQSEGRRGAAAGWLLASLAWVAAGTAVRETGGLLLPAVGLYLLAVGLGWAGPGACAGRGRTGRWFLFLLATGIGAAAAAVGVAAIVIGGGAVVTGQGAYMLRYAPDFLSQPFASLPLRALLAAIPGEFGFAGMVCLAVGLAAAFRRRNRDFLFFFLLPALANLAFDGVIKFHWRFLLTTVFFLAPIAALGACGIAGFAWRTAWRMAEGRGWIPSRWRARAVEAGWIAACVAMLGWGVRTVGRFGPWGLAVTRAEVDRCVEVLSPWTEGGRPVLVDERSRYLIDVLEVFTDWPIREVAPGNGADCVADPPLAYVQAANAAAVYQHRRFDNPPGERVLEGHGDLQPLPDGEFRLGRSAYRVLRVRPWTAHSVAVRLPPPPESGMVPEPHGRMLRVMIPAGADQAPVRVSLGGFPLADDLGPGCHFLSVSDEILDGIAAGDGGEGPELQFESDAPLPAGIPARWIHPEERFRMAFGIPYPPSCNALLSESWPETDGADGDAVAERAEFLRDVWIRIPDGLDGGEGTGGAEYIVEAELGAVRWTDCGEMRVSLSLPEFPDVAPPPVQRRSLEQAQGFRFSLGRLPHVPHVLRLHADRIVESPPGMAEEASGWRTRLDGVSLCVRRRVDSLSIEVGRPTDDLMLEGGFFQREDPHGPGHGRWTAEKAEVALPLAPGRDYRIEVDFSALRPDAAVPANPRFLLDGQPLETEATGSGLAALVPADRIGEGNRLAIETDTWCPAEHGAGDKRRLGIFIHAIRAVPL